MNDHLFVYGSLLHSIPSQMATFLRSQGQFQGEAYLEGRLFDLGRYPGVVYEPGKGKEVFGHLYQLSVPEACFPRLDFYEGIHPSQPEKGEYIRRKCPVRFRGKMVESWVYLYNFDTAALTEITSGNYLIYLQSDASDDHQQFIDSV